MGYYQADVYYQPEQFGLTPIGEVNAGGSYEFDIVAVWQHADSRWFLAADSGCSCPSPFEDFTSLESLTEFTSVAQLAQAMAHLLKDESPWQFQATQLLGRVAALM